MAQKDLKDKVEYSVNKTAEKAQAYASKNWNNPAFWTAAAVGFVVGLVMGGFFF